MQQALVSQFGASDARASALAQQYSAAVVADVHQPLIGLAYNRETDTPYFYIQHLGSGTFGYVVSASIDGSRMPTYVVKQVRIKRNYYIELVEREYRIGQMIRERVGEEFCAEHVVCALDRFYDANRATGFIVFRFNTTWSLRSYLITHLHPRMLEYEAQLAAGVDDRATLDQLRALAADICLQLLFALSVLHDHRIYHSDLKPANMIVNDDDGGEPLQRRRLRLIDFGFSCAFSGRLESRRPTLNEVRCHENYRTTPMYRDPLARVRQMARVDLEERYAKYDVYAAAKTMQGVFDPSLDLVVGYPVVRETLFMPPGVLTLLERMTGERNYRPADIHRPELTAAEVRARERAFGKRPYMSAALREYSHHIESYWPRDEISLRSNQ